MNPFSTLRQQSASPSHSKWRRWAAAWGIAILFPALAWAQSSRSLTVRDALTAEPLQLATWRTLHSTQGGLTDAHGIALLPAQVQDSLLIVQFAGYRPDTLQGFAQGLTVELHPLTQDPVVITGGLKPSYLSQSPIKTEVLSRAFLESLPAQTMIEAVDFVNGVNQQINCGVCGTNDIHINGMEGPYTLVLLDGMPIVSALGTVYGLNGIPSSMIERIEVVKGPGSTLYGADALAGVINIITRDPRTAPRLMLSATGNTHSEWNGDFAASQKVGKASTLLSGNVYSLQRRMDANGDNFTDVPLAQRISLMNKWTLERPHHREATLAAKAFHENRFGGQMQWLQGHEGSDSIYGESILTQRAEVMAAYDLPTRERMRLSASWAGHAQDSWYGTTPYVAQQHTLFANLAGFHTHRRHELLYGAAVRTNLYDDNTPATPRRDVRTTPGIFLQDEWTQGVRLSTLVGLRADLDRDLGPVLSPRVNLRWKPTTWGTLRITAGSGFRNVNLFTEDHAALTGSRSVVVLETLRPERSWNVSATWTQVVNVGNSAATLDVDAFHTHFLNKIIPDYDTDPNLILYRNLAGHGTVQGASVKWAHALSKPLRYEAGGTFLRVINVDGDGNRTWQVHAPWFSGVFSAGYEVRKLRTRVDWNGKVTGPMRLPSFPGRSEVSAWWSLQHVQFTTTVGKQWKLLYGVKNLLNYTQPSPLISPDAPFSDSFDTAYIYGPLQPRRFFLGVEWRM